MNELREQIEAMLDKVSKPSRYIDSEINAVHKNWNEFPRRVALVYPDIYDVGLPNLGLQILYRLINDRSDWLAERAYLPWPDMISALQEHSLPLFSLESWRPLEQFDVIGISLQHELTFSNIPTLLQLARLPVLSRERNSDHPIILGGGPSAYNPEPVADFFDALIIGEAEEAISEFLDALSGFPVLNGHRDDLLRRLTEIPGIYVPGLYTPKYDNGIFVDLAPVDDGIPDKVTRRVVADLEAWPILDEPIVPYADVVHDRSSIEIMRGCSRGCRFCQAGIIYRPVRERKVEAIIQAVAKSIGATGHDEVSLASLSSADYSEIEMLLETLARTADPQRVTISLPSLRVDTLSVDLAKRIGAVRKSGLTMAPEAGTQRLRDTINKCVTDEDIESAVAKAFSSGWQKIKLYFMIGLPTETEEDILGIAKTVRRIRHTALDHTPKAKHARINITVSVSSFVPKAHTPLQWHGSNDLSTLLTKQDILRQELRMSHVRFKWHDAEQSIFEAALARGDRRFAKILAVGAGEGLMLDAWSDMFVWQRWQQIFTDHGIDLEQCACEEIPTSRRLPWEHIDSGISREWLIEESKKASQGQVTADCREICTGCGLCPGLGVDHVIRVRT